MPGAYPTVSPLASHNKNRTKRAAGIVAMVRDDTGGFRLAATPGLLPGIFRAMTRSMQIRGDVIEFFGDQVRMGYVATARPDGHLAVVPVGVVLHDGKVRISSPTETFKVRNLRHDPHIAVCIPDPGDPRRYLMIRGTAVVEADPDRAFLDWMAREHMGLDSHPDKRTVRSMITIVPQRFVFAGTHDG